MIKSYTITIDEIDDAEEASGQAAEKLASCALLRNTLGIIAAHPEFVSNGVYARVAKALPFPVIGTTTVSHCAPDAAGIFIMSVLILTSDDCGFSHSVSAPALQDCDAAEITRGMYEEARGKLGSEPKLAFLYAPFLDKPNTSEYVAALTGINSGLPIFGAITNDDHSSANESSARTLCCGEAFDDRYALALVCGPIDPKFYITSVTEDAVVMPDIGVVTAAHKNKLLEVNSVNATEFFKGVGFLSHDVVLNRDSGMLSSIFVFRIKGEDGGDISISRIPVRVESDGITCGGRIIEGAVISVAFNTNESVFETASQLMKAIREKHGGGTVVINSCLGRRYGLLNEPLKELAAIRDILGNSFNYTAVYVNGELCPISASGNTVHNQDHNQTLVACVF